jgi:murein L,D-transpeptidase YafK
MAHPYAPNPARRRRNIAAAVVLVPGLLALLAPANAAMPDDVALVRVEKSARRLVVLDGEGRTLITIGGIQLGDPRGPKRFQGDRRTPEGHYLIDRGNEQSAYHLSLHISYPAPADRAFAAANGRAPGGDIFIHGQPNSIHNGRIAGDWTDGCVAVSNAEIEQLWALVPDGTPIDLLP